MKYLTRLRHIARILSNRSGNDSYAVSKLQEMQIFNELNAFHDLPPIFHYWSNKYLKPMFEASGFESIDQFFALNLGHAMQPDSHFLSIGSGACDTEIRVARLLLEIGLKSFKFECLELNPALLERGRQMAESEGISHLMLFTEADLNRWKPQCVYSGVMANHSLHHVVNLEGLFDGVKESLDMNSNFVVNDIIGRNGHQRWPEALRVIDHFWEELPDSYRYNHQLKREEIKYVNWDCSTEGFEGVRAQDILPLLLERFNFRYFFAFANVVAPFVDRGFGHNFDADNEWDRSFIDRLHTADEAGFMSGELKPTQMLSVLTTGHVESPTFVRGLSPEFSVRTAAVDKL